MPRQPSAVFVFGIIGAMSFAEPAYAYLDPGTGSMILQGMLGAVAAGLYALKLQWSRIRAFFETRSAKRDASKGQ